MDCFITQLLACILTDKSSFTYKIIPSYSSSKTQWGSVLLLRTSPHLSCYHLPPWLLLSSFLSLQWALARKHNFIYFWNQPRDGLAASIIAEWQFIVIPHFLVERRLSALQIPQAGLASPARSPHSVLLGSLLTGTAARREADNNNNNCPRTILVALCRQNNGRRYFWQNPTSSCNSVCIITLSFEAQIDYDQRRCRAASPFVQLSISSLLIEMSICPQLSRVLLNRTKADQT